MGFLATIHNSQHLKDMKYQILFFAIGLSLFACKSLKNQKTELEAKPTGTTSVLTTEVVDSLSAHGISPAMIVDALAVSVSQTVTATDTTLASVNMSIIDGVLVQENVSAKSDTVLALVGTKGIILLPFKDTLENGDIVLAFCIAFKGGTLKNKEYLIFAPNESGVYQLLIYEEDGQYIDFGGRKQKLTSGAETVLLFTLKQKEVAQKGKTRELKNRGVKNKKVVPQKKE